MLKLGYLSAIFPDYTYEQVIDFAGQNGFSCVEVACWPKGKALRRYAGVTHIDLDEPDASVIKHCVDYAGKQGVSISSLAYYPNPLSPDAAAASAAVSHIKKLIAVSSGMGVGMVTTFIGRDKNKTVEQNLLQFEAVWAPLVKLAEDKGVKIAIENCPMLFTEDEWPGGNNLAAAPYIWREMFRLLPSENLGLNYDPSHLHLIGADYIKPVYAFSDKIFHVHFKDIRIHKDRLDEYGRFAYPLKWHTPKLPGLGDIDFGSLCSALYDIGYSGPACIEIEDRAFEGSDEVVRSGITQSARYLRNFL